MTTQMKWLIGSIPFLAVVFVIAYNFGVQNIATRTTSEVDLLAESISVGLVRANVENHKDGYQNFDKEELVANLIANVSTVQKKHKYKINLEYVFLDANGQVTESEENIRGLQFHVQYIDKGGKVRANAERRLALNYIDED